MSRWKAPLVAAAVVFVVGQAGTLMLSRNAEDQAAARQVAEFEGRVDNAVQVMEERLLTAAVAVEALDGLFRADREVDRREYHEFAHSLLDVASVRHLAFVKAIPTSQREALIHQVRQDTSISPVGYPGFDVNPATTSHDEMFVSFYIEPLEEENPAFGFDLGTDSPRRAAIEKARDTGGLVATGGLELISDSSQGVLLMLPIYASGEPPGEVSDRRRQFEGVVQGVIAINPLLRDLPGVGVSLDLAVYDSIEPSLPRDDEDLLYRSAGEIEDSGTPTAERRLEVGDREWTIVAWRVAASPGFGALNSVPSVMTFAGTLLTIALAITFFTIVDSREAAHHRARILTSELREQAEHLRSARDRAVEADRLKTGFLANMSHELRTPLTAVIGLSSVLLKNTLGPLEGRQRGYVEMISTSGSHLLDIVDDMLDLARIEAGRDDLKVEQIDLAVVVGETVKMIGPLAQTKGVELVHPHIADALVVEADQRRIQQVLLNILSNAVKFTDRGGRAGVSVATKQGLVAVTIWDTGIGIPADHIGRVFAPFHQVDSSLARSRAGSGLGLALAKRLTEMHGGDLNVSSREGAGTEFTLTLPLVGPSASNSASDATTDDRPELDGARVLVAEDNEVNRLLMTDLLRLAGCEVLEAVDGEGTLATARAEEVDLIVLDIMLPVMDGITVAKLLKSNKKLRRIPIIAVTALAMPEDRQRILAAGCDSYLAKPFTHDQFLSAVAVLLGARARV